MRISSEIHLRMHFLQVLMLIFVISHDTLEYIVRGSGPLVVPLGSSVVLPCYTETPLVTEKLKVVWRRTDSDTLVHLYQDGESRPEEQQQDYHDRAHFFTDQIQHGNFSLHLENVRAEDKGVYICKVYSQQDSDKILVEIKDVEYLLVSGSDESISVSVGEDVTLNCSVDSHITPEHIEVVSWKKTDEHEDMLVLRYQNNETQSDSSDEQYRDRAEFLTDEKQNFSLRLKSVRPEDKGVYMCQAFAGGLSANATVVLKILGFSVSHIMVLILCITASGSALLFYCLVCSNPEDEDTSCLQVCLFHGTNIIMLLASIIWGFFEGSLYETILCCMLYILRPLRLIWFRPYITACPDKILKYIKSSHADQYYPAFTVLMYSVLLVEHFKDISTDIKTVAIGLLFLVCLFFIIQLAACSGNLGRRIYEVKQIVATCSFSLLPSLQLTLLLYTHFVSNTVLIVTFLAASYWLFSSNCYKKRWGKQFCKCCLDITIRTMVIAMSGVMIYLYTALLRKKKEGAGLVCVAGFVQALWVLAFSEVPVSYLNLCYRNILFLFGSAGLVLVNSAALMTDVIMKAVNGERLVGDLRIVVFPSEWIFTVPLLILSIITPRKPINIESQSLDSKGTPATAYTSIDVNQRKGESIEMETLGEVAGNCEEQQEEINS